MNPRPNITDQYTVHLATCVNFQMYFTVYVTNILLGVHMLHLFHNTISRCYVKSDDIVHILHIHHNKNEALIG